MDDQEVKVLLAKSIIDLCTEKLDPQGVYSINGHVNIITSNNQQLHVHIEHIAESVHDVATASVIQEKIISRNTGVKETFDQVIRCQKSTDANVANVDQIEDITVKEELQDEDSFELMVHHSAESELDVVSRMNAAQVPCSKSLTTGAMQRPISEALVYQHLDIPPTAVARPQAHAAFNTPVMADMQVKSEPQESYLQDNPDCLFENSGSTTHECNNCGHETIGSAYGQAVSLGGNQRQRGSISSKEIGCLGDEMNNHCANNLVSSDLSVPGKNVEDAGKDICDNNQQSRKHNNFCYHQVDNACQSQTDSTLSSSNSLLSHRRALNISKKSCPIDPADMGIDVVKVEQVEVCNIEQRTDWLNKTQTSSNTLQSSTVTVEKLYGNEETDKIGAGEQIDEEHEVRLLKMEPGRELEGNKVPTRWKTKILSWKSPISTAFSATQEPYGDICEQLQSHSPTQVNPKENTDEIGSGVQDRSLPQRFRQTYFMCARPGEDGLTEVNKMKNNNTSDSGTNLYVCVTCGKGFAQARYLRQHKYAHILEKPYVCRTCGKGFKRAQGLKYHEYTHTEKPNVCKICGKGFAHASSLKLHEIKHTGQKAHVCKTCGKEFTYAHSLRRHECTHTGRKPHVCMICGKGFAEAVNLKQHEYTHTGERPYVCKTCGKRFGNVYTFTRHEYLHTGRKPFVCEVCGKAFAQAFALRQHEYIHTGEKRHVCKVCGRGFMEAFRLKTHEYTHTGERPYVCKYSKTCGKAFAQPQHLKQHGFAHTGEKPYVCETCGKAFIHAFLLKSHENIHTGRKPFSCKTCGKGFAQASGLKHHEYIHSEHKPHVCKICGKGFSRSGTLKQHGYTHTKDKPHICKTCGKGFKTVPHLKRHGYIHSSKTMYAYGNLLN